MKRIVWFFCVCFVFSASACNESASKKVDQQKAAKSLYRNTCGYYNHDL